MRKTKPPSPNVFTESKVASYYDNIEFKDLNFEFSETSPEKVLNNLKGLNPSKAAGIDNLSRKFPKDGADVLARPISQLCNRSICFLEVVKLQKSNRFFKKAPKLNPFTPNYHPISLLPI